MKQFSNITGSLDVKQNEAIEVVANKLARRKGVIDENLKLEHELKVSDVPFVTFGLTLAHD